mmetsp:Transcript_23056/g.35681  ORF Transcript_23056/g.35681 Transcript_23056/m.35681 type:complete len:186 (-) Transcript_23056:532-1089(-)|eukprot:CAMPEP_0170484298 /NCGR_PEP_ID=MMETSP0208-20121228/3789_1 /TAXON_ID=197538 /ORGANISM="Strombidium inclinatum, Strain S3" /LENGTH=185 /DNA_ID=CAMNT_0010757597 /DNA_START=345 /DNA_END=902 /DNA_ORIENTATION=-
MVLYRSYVLNYPSMLKPLKECFAEEHRILGRMTSAEREEINERKYKTFNPQKAKFLITRCDRFPTETSKKRVLKAQDKAAGDPSQAQIEPKAELAISPRSIKQDALEESSSLQNPEEDEFGAPSLPSAPTAPRQRTPHGSERPSDIEKAEVTPSGTDLSLAEKEEDSLNSQAEPQSMASQKEPEG